METLVVLAAALAVATGASAPLAKRGAHPELTQATFHSASSASSELCGQVCSDRPGAQRPAQQALPALPAPHVISEEWHTHINRKIAVPVAQPYPVAVHRNVPYPQPVAVPYHVDRPYAVPVPVHQPYPVDHPVPTPVERQVPVPAPYPVPVAVREPVPVPMSQPAPVVRHYPVPVPVYIPVYVQPQPAPALVEHVHHVQDHVHAAPPTQQSPPVTAAAAANVASTTPPTMLAASAAAAAAAAAASAAAPPNQYLPPTSQYLPPFPPTDEYPSPQDGAQGSLPSGAPGDVDQTVPLEAPLSSHFDTNDFNSNNLEAPSLENSFGSRGSHK